MYYHIQSAACIKDYFVSLQFEDGTHGIVNFEKIAGQGEAFGPLKDLDYFCHMKLDDRSHTLEWPNGADICPEVLYEAVKKAPNHIATLE